MLRSLLDFESDNSKREEIFTLDLLSHRIIDYIKLQIKKISTSLKINDQSAECVWQLMKHIFLKVKYVFVNRYIDQLILCSFYSIFKIRGIKFQFKEIISKFVVKSFFPKNINQEIIHKCLLKADVFYSDGNLYTKTFSKGNFKKRRNY